VVAVEAVVLAAVVAAVEVLAVVKAVVDVVTAVVVSVLAVVAVVAVVAVPVPSAPHTRKHRYKTCQLTALPLANVRGLIARAHSRTRVAQHAEQHVSECERKHFNASDERSSGALTGDLLYVVQHPTTCTRCVSLSESGFLN